MKTEKSTFRKEKHLNYNLFNEICFNRKRFSFAFSSSLCAYDLSTQLHHSYEMKCLKNKPKVSIRKDDNDTYPRNIEIEMLLLPHFICSGIIVTKINCKTF